MTDRTLRLAVAKRVLDHLQQLISDGESDGLIRFSTTPRSAWTSARGLVFLVDAGSMGDAARTLISHMEEVDCLLFHIEWGSNHTHIELIDSRADPNSERPVVTIDLISLPITRGVGFRILYGSSKALAWLRYLLKPIDRIGNSGVVRLRSIGHVTNPLLLVTEGC